LETIAQISMTLTERLNSMEQERLLSTIFSVFLNVESTKSIPTEFQ
jgi:hypothetical protein